MHVLTVVDNFEFKENRKWCSFSDGLPLQKEKHMTYT